MQEPKQDKNATTKTDRQQTAVKSVSRNGQGIAASPLDPLVQQVSRMGNAPNPSAHAAILNRAPANQQSSNRQLLLQLQQQYGNPYVNQVLQLARGMGGQTAANTTKKPLMQAKLTIGSVGDKYEQEADRTAQQVVQRMNAPSQSDRGQAIGREAIPEAELQKKPEISTIQRQEMPKEKEEEQQAEVKQETDSLQLQKKCGGCEKKEEDNLAQMKPETGTFPQEELPKDEEKEELTMQPLVEHQPAEGGMAATPKLETSIQQKRGRGQPLSDKLREPMEQAFGKDFSGVRVHADAQSDQINRSIQARAFTTGQDIFFRQGEYASGSKQGQELLAHELTHVVQQNGSAIKAKTEEGVTLSELSPDARVQRLCSNCEKEEKPENTLQAKEVSSGTLAVAPEPEVSISQVTQPAIQRVFDDLPDRREPKAPKQEKEKQPEAPEETAESDTSDCDQQGDANKPQPEAQQEEQQPEKCPSEKEDKGKKQPKPEKTKPLKDKLSEKPASCVRQEQNPILQAFAPIPTATPNLTARSAITTATNTSTPQQNLQATGETASPETATEKVQATTTATEAQGQLRTTDAEVARLASSKINFKLPKQEETDTDNNSAALEEQRAAASSMASNFFAEAALRIQTVTGLGQSISARINGVAENAKASVMSTVQQQQDAVAAQINQQRTQVNSQAQRSIAEIQQQYQATLRNISLRTAEVSQRIQTEYSNAFQKVDQGETNLLSRVDQLYIQTYDQYIAAGDTVGNEATAVGEKWVKQWESEITDKYSNEDAVFEDRGHMRSTPPNPGKTVEVVKNGKLGKKASTAKEVAKQYKEQVTEEATKQANNLVKGKAKDIKGICCAIKEFRKQLQKQQEETLKAVIDLQQDAVLQVTEAQTKLTESANQTLQATLQSLDEQETAQLQILQGYGDRQVLAIERDAQKAIASLQKGVNQAANKLLTALQDYYSEFQGMEAPNPDELSVTLAEILGQFDSSIGTVQKETEKGIAVSEDGIAQGEQQAVSAVGAIAQTVMEESAAVVEEAKTSFNNLDRGITNTFNQLRDAYTQAANKFVEATAKGLAQITQNSQNPLEQIYQKLSEALQKSVTQIETGLRDTLKCLETDIQNYAAKAVEDEPWWKSLLKALVFIVVIVVAIVLAPTGIGFVAGALGEGIAATIFASVVVGAALGAGLGALSQIANNAIDGKNLMDGVGKAALAGAIGGAIGGFGGVLGGVLGNVGKLGVGLSKTWSKFGIETVFDTLGNIFGDLAAGNPITWEGVLIGAAIGAGTYVATTKGTLRRLGKPGEKIQSFQERSSEAGMRSGAFVGGKVKTAFGGKADTSVNSRSGVAVTGAKPSETEVKAPKTSVPGGRGVDIPTVSRPDVDVNTPSNRPDIGTETPRGLKPDTDLRMTQREQEVLENTAHKDGDKLTPEEIKAELKVAGRAERKLIDEREYVEEIELPNGHKLKRRRSDGGWCRFSSMPTCLSPGSQPDEVDTDEEMLSEPEQTHESGLGNLTTQLVVHTNNEIKEVRIIGRPEKLFSNSMGDHTTAFAAHVGGLIVRLKGKNYQKAIEGMNELVEKLTNLPGTELVDSLPKLHKAKYEDALKKLKEIKAKLTQTSKDTTKWLDLQDYVNAYLSWRELLPLSGINVMDVVPGRAGKGKGEGVKNLMKYQRRESVDNKKVKQEILDNFDPQGVAIAILAKAEGFDLEEVAPGISENMQNDEIVEIYVQQHLNSMTVYFPIAMKKHGDVKTELIKKVKDLLNQEVTSWIETNNKLLKTRNSDFNELYRTYKNKPNKFDEERITKLLPERFKYASNIKALKDVKGEAQDEKATLLVENWKKDIDDWEEKKSIKSIEEDMKKERESSTTNQIKTRSSSKRKAEEISTGEDKAPLEAKQKALKAEKAALKKEELKSPLATQLRLDSEGKINQLRSGGRSLSPFSGTMGAHTTAWIVRVDRVREALLGKSINKAIEAFEILLSEVKTYEKNMLEVFKAPTGLKEKEFKENVEKELTETLKAAKNSTLESEKVLLLQESVNFLLTYENHIPGSTLNSGSLNPGNSEGKHRETLRNPGDKTANEINNAINGLLDLKDPSLTAKQKKALKLAHKTIISKTYPQAYGKK